MKKRLGYIYKLESKDPNITKIYFGSTRNWKRRIREHKYNTNTPSSKEYHRAVYQYIRQNGGFDTWQLRLVEVCDATKIELTELERKWIENNPNCLNQALPNHSYQEWYEENKQRISEKRSQKINCQECGRCMTLGSIWQHKRKFCKKIIPESEKEVDCD